MAEIAKIGGIATPEEAEEISRDTRIKLYDFRRPDKFSKEQLRTISIMHETFARLATTYISARARHSFEIHVASVDQLTYEEFIKSIPDPTTMAILQMNPLLCRTLLEIDPDIQFALIDRTLGGEGIPIPENREITDFEFTVTKDFLTGIIKALADSWKPVLEIRPVITAIETKPAFAQIVPPSEMVVLVTFEVKTMHASGMMNFCIPFLTIEPILERLSAIYMYSSFGKSAYAGGRFQTDNIETSARIVLDGPSYPVPELSRIKKGTLIPLPSPGDEMWPGNEDEPWYLEAGGAKICSLKKAPGSWSFSLNLLKDETLELLPPQPLKGTSSEEDKTLTLITGTLERFERKLSELSNAQTQIADEMNMPSDKGRILSSPFSFIGIKDAVEVSVLLKHEHPQLIALLLSYIDDDAAALILSNLPEEIQADVIKRIHALWGCDPGLLEIIEQTLEKKLSLRGGKSIETQGGIQKTVSILNKAPRQVERNIIKTLDSTARDISNEIKKNMFIFEDIILLDSMALKKTAAAVNPEVFALALKACDENIAAKITEALPGEYKKDIAGIKKNMGMVRIKDTEEAQQSIVQAIRDLEENGDIVVAHPDDWLVE